jgi:hypothetical protein
VFAYLLVFGSGLVGSLLLTQLANAGIWYADILEFIPSLALYRYGCMCRDARNGAYACICTWKLKFVPAGACCQAMPRAASIYPKILLLYRLQGLV